MACMCRIQGVKNKFGKGTEEATKHSPQIIFKRGAKTVIFVPLGWISQGDPEQGKPHESPLAKVDLECDKRGVRRNTVLQKMGRGRDAGCPAPPAQIRT